MDGVKMVKVDNWSVFFLQKLQTLYTRGDFTDLTLQFHTNECIKVHRLVLNTCTEYFEALMKHNKASHHMRLPPNLQSDVVVPIINFMYSGRLEFRPELQSRLYNTAKILNMQILIKLLETHVSAPFKSSSNNSGSISSSGKHKNTPISSLVSASNTISPKLVRVEPENSDIVPGKRLPIWKKRTTPSSSFSVNVTPRTVIEEPAKPTRFEWPEDGDSDSAPLLYSSTFDDISYDSVPIVKSINSIVQSALPPTPSEPLVQLPQQRVMPAATFESVYQSSQLKRDASKSQGSQSENTPIKKARVDIEEVKEFSQEQEVRRGLISEENDIACGDLDDLMPAAEEEDVSDNSACGFLSSHQLPSPSSQIQSAPKPILKITESPETCKETTPSKKVRFHLEHEVQLQRSGDPLNSDSTAASNVGPVQIVAENQSEIPSEGQLGVTGITTKKIVDPSGNMFEIRASTTSVKKSAGGTTIQAKVPNVTNHAKIIAEVLKKYPDLVKNNRNIRLKIMQKDGSQAVSVEKSGGSSENKPKVSYMVVKADQGMKSKVQLEQAPQQQSGAHNVTGPWICSGCQPDQPINFESYYLYRKHLQDVHQEKIDVRICEHCGHRASKRNLLLYHLYKIHGIPPPPSCHFPKCDQCGYIALSEALLAKHKNAHGTTALKDVTCRGCNVSFKNYASLHAHLTSGVLCSQNKQNFRCPVCSKIFQRQVNLKNHIRTDHKDLKLLEDMSDSNEEEVCEDYEEDDEVEDPLMSGTVPSVSSTMPTDSVTLHQHQPEHVTHQIIRNQAVMEVQPDVHQGTVSIQQPTTYILPPGVTILTESAQGTLMPSTEAEALSNVASGIAASLGVADGMVVSDQAQHQTLILVDKNQVIQIPGPAGAGGTQVHEYIVPDIMANDMGQSVGLYTSGHLSQLVQYAPAGTLQQPVAVSTDQGLMTITAVNANGSIVSQASSAPLMEQSIMQIPQGHLTDHNGGEIAMILTDHAYSEGMVRENGTVIQTTVPVSMSMVPTTAVVTVVPTVGTIHQSRSIIDNGAQHGLEAIIKGDGDACVSSNAAVILESAQHPPPPQTQKMAELVSDWDDDENNDEGSVLPRTTDEIAEDSALPSRPTIMLKAELDGDNLSDNVQVKMA